MFKRHAQLRLKIEPVVERADELASIVARDLPTHKGLGKAVRGVANSSRHAQRVAARLQRFMGLHRLPALFLLLSLGAVGFWGYWNFLHNSKLVIAVSARDAVQLKSNVGHRVRLVPVETVGSRESISLLQSGDVDLAFVQGGVEIPSELLRTELEATELVLFFLRDDLEDVSTVKKILTSSEGQGSHTLAQRFVEAWRIEDQVEFTFDWRTLTDESEYLIPEDVDAIFVVKDPMNEKVTATIPRLNQAGYRLAYPDIGATSLRLPFLREAEVRAGFLDPVSHLPETPVPTYAVSTYLVARPKLTPRQMAAASHLQAVGADGLSATAFEPTLDRASDAAQGIEAMVSLVIYIGLAFIALLGLDIITYRRYFNELNTLVSLISMHQSSKDAVSGDEESRLHNIEYLRICSDLLGLISVITGYYMQENPSLLYHRLPEIIHDRCDALKINIQLKILHGLTNHGQCLAAPVTQSTEPLQGDSMQVRTIDGAIGSADTPGDHPEKESD